MSMPTNKIPVEDIVPTLETRAFAVEGRTDTERDINVLDAASEEEMSSAWRGEIHKRCREVNEGIVELRTVDDAFARAYAALG